MAAFSHDRHALNELQTCPSSSWLGAAKASKLFRLRSRIEMDHAHHSISRTLSRRVLKISFGSRSPHRVPAHPLEAATMDHLRRAHRQASKPCSRMIPPRMGLHSLRYHGSLVAPGWNVSAQGGARTAGVALGHNEHIAGDSPSWPRPADLRRRN